MKITTIALALTLASGAAWPQERPELGPPLPEGHQGGEQQARKEMIELFQRVETRLKEIDQLLYDASAGDAGLAGTEETVIGELLRTTAGKSDEVLSGIDRILEIAEQFGGAQGGGSCEQAMEGDSPLDHQPQGEQGQKEQAPEIGPEPHEEPGEEQQDGQGGGRPDSPQESQARPENRDATREPPTGETGRVEVTDTTERWGDLPVHVRELFRNEGGGELPSQYRDWIDGYYRRLNRRK